MKIDTVKLNSLNAGYGYYNNSKTDSNLPLKGNDCQVNCGPKQDVTQFKKKLDVPASKNPFKNFFASASKALKSIFSPKFEADSSLTDADFDQLILSRAYVL